MGCGDNGKNELSSQVSFVAWDIQMDDEGFDEDESDLRKGQTYSACLMQQR